MYIIYIDFVKIYRYKSYYGIKGKINYKYYKEYVRVGPLPPGRGVRSISNTESRRDGVPNRKGVSRLKTCCSAAGAGSTPLLKDVENMKIPKHEIVVMRKSGYILSVETVKEILVCEYNKDQDRVRVIVND